MLEALCILTFNFSTFSFPVKLMTQLVTYLFQMNESFHRIAYVLDQLNSSR